MSFQRFYETWFDQLKEIVRQLNQVPRPATSDHHRELHQLLVQKVVSHIYEYYRVKSLAAKNDILSVFSAPWSTSLERSLHWIAGWRPTTAFHLIYTESSILFESHIIDILRGLRYGDLGDLSPEQLARVSEFQCETVHEENSITDELNDWQARNPNLSSFFFFLLRPLCLFTIIEIFNFKRIEKLDLIWSSESPNYHEFCFN